LGPPGAGRSTLTEGHPRAEDDVEKEDPMARWEDFKKCPGCGLDIATGEGERSCRWGDCAYLPEELDVYCDTCRFNFFTGEGNPSCEDPFTCEHAAEPLRHVENVRTWIARTTAGRRA
jgi:hypothetical protein